MYCNTLIRIHNTYYGNCLNNVILWSFKRELFDYVMQINLKI